MTKSYISLGIVNSSLYNMLNSSFKQGEEKEKKNDIINQIESVQTEETSNILPLINDNASGREVKAEGPQPLSPSVSWLCFSWSLSWGRGAE